MSAPVMTLYSRESVPEELLSQRLSHSVDLKEKAPQHLQALSYANKIRKARASLKRKIASGEVTPSAVIEERPNEAESMTIFDLLVCQRRWGQTRCRKLLAALGIAETKAIGSLTQRQRTALLTSLEKGSRIPRGAKKPTTLYALPFDN